MRNQSFRNLSIVCVTLLVLALGYAEIGSTKRLPTSSTAPLHGAAALEQLKQDGHYESLQAAMKKARFSVSPMAHSPLGGAAWHAPNAAAGYDAYVTEKGVSLSLTAQTQVSLYLHRLGYGNNLRTVAPGTVSGDQQSIHIERPGVREWFVNGPAGLEHGFTLSEPPGQRQAGVPLRLALQVGKGWRAVPTEAGKRVSLRNEDGQAVEYGKLFARDNAGHTIPAQLTVIDEEVVIEASDNEAEYPLTIDPLFTLQQKLLAADAAAEDYLGFSVALSGNTALVGAPYDDQKRGAAYVFVRNGATWTQQTKLTAQDGTSFDYFGWSVALKDNTAVVGALYGLGSLHPEQGAAYVFVRGGSTWSFQQRLTASENTHGAQFGAALALDGDTVLVGAPSYTITPSFADIGAVFVFVRNGATWTQQMRLNANDGEDGDSFGVTLALEGDTALIGAPNNAITFGGQGAAYVFTRSGTLWTQRQRLLAVQPAADDHFGNAVALSGDNALIGAYLWNFNNGVTVIPDCGAVYNFVRGTTGWAQVSRISAPNPTTGAQFGVSVALSGSTAVVGAARGLFQPGVEQRSAYVFEHLGEWALVRQFGPELGAADDGFGYAVALSGDTVLVGAYKSDVPATDQGAAYTFVLHDSRHAEQQKLFANDGTSNDYFGKAVALSGDTLAVGAWGYGSGTIVNQGAVYLFTRTGATWTFQQKLTANDGLGGDNFGYAVALDGDTLAVGAYADDISGNANQGSAYIFTRNGSGWTQQQKLMAFAIDGLPNDYFGCAVSLSGNTVAIGAWGVDNSRGATYVFTRNGTTWTQQQKLSANDAAPGDNFGYAVALDGNTLAVGAFRDTIGTTFQQGSVYLFARNGTVWTQQPKLTAAQGTTEDHFGLAVALKGDTLLVGAPSTSVGAQAGPGAAYVFGRTGTVWSQIQKLTADVSSTGSFYGIAVAINHDMLVVGAMSDRVDTNSSRGAAYIYTRLGNWVKQQKLSASDGATYDYFGSGVALSGDTIAVGAYGDDFGDNAEQGSAYVFASPACPAITIAPNSLPNGAADVAYNQSLTESGGGTGEYVLSVSRGTLPPGLTLGSNPGRLQGTPTTPGTYRFTITATFVLSGCTGSREYTLTISPCPTITVSPPALPNGVVGAAYNREVTATGGTGQHSFAVTAGALPPGLSLSLFGVLSGTPTQAGSYNFTVTATSIACTGTRDYTLIILATCPTLTVTPPVLPVGAVGAVYSQTVNVMGGVAPYTFALNIGSNVPPGLAFINGVLSGTPTQAGTYGFTVRIRDANNCPGSQGYSVTINPPCEPITINPPTLPNGTTGAAYSQTLTATVNAFSVSFAVTAGALPPGLSLSSSGNLSGTPTQAGSYNFTVTASASGCTGTRSYTLTVNLPVPLRAQKGDFDGDGKADLSVWTPNTGNWEVRRSSNNQVQHTLWGAGYAPYFDVIVPGDYDGDGKFDQAIWRGQDSLWYIRKSSDGQPKTQLWGANYAPYNDVPTPGDFDGDGKTDIAVWRPTTGTWYVLRSSDNAMLVEVWGQFGDTPVAADYDGDGKADLAYWRPGNGTWYIKQSSGGTAIIAWGAGYAPYYDVPVAADYDGDGKADLAIWRGQDSLWYIRPSATPNTPQVQLWGASYAPYHDVPVPADYDGDGKADIAVWRPATATWYVLNSSDSTTFVQSHGQPGDVPVTKVQ